MTELWFFWKLRQASKGPNSCKRGLHRGCVYGSVFFSYSPEVWVVVPLLVDIRFGSGLGD